MQPNPIFKSHLDSEFNGCVHTMLTSKSLGEFIQKLSLAGFDLHRDIDLIKRMHDEAKTKLELKSWHDPEDALIRALQGLSRNTETLDFVVDYGHRTKLLKRRTWGAGPLHGAARCALRMADGSLRDPADFGLQTGGQKLSVTLLEQALEHRDSECIKHLRTFPLASKLITDEYLDTKIRRWAEGDAYEDFISIFDEFLLKRVQGALTLQGYWELLESYKIFNPRTATARIDDHFLHDLVKKHPDAFVDKLLKLSRWEEPGSNKFILLMINEGIDCYPGYILAYEGAFAAFDKKDKPRDYQGMIDVCLKRRSLPGYEALLNCIPLDEIQNHPRKDLVLNLIHQMTGRADVVKLMANKNKGKALESDLGL